MSDGDRLPVSRRDGRKSNSTSRTCLSNSRRTRIRALSATTLSAQTFQVTWWLVTSALAGVSRMALTGHDEPPLLRSEFGLE